MLIKEPSLERNHIKVLNSFFFLLNILLEKTLESQLYTNKVTIHFEQVRNTNWLYRWPNNKKKARQQRKINKNSILIMTACFIIARSKLWQVWGSNCHLISIRNIILVAIIFANIYRWYQILRFNNNNDIEKLGDMASKCQAHSRIICIK